MSCQLSLFSDKPEPLKSIRKQTSKKLSLTKICTTKQAAILLDTSISTLYRRRKLGQCYRNVETGWTGKPVGSNSWLLIL